MADAAAVSDRIDQAERRLAALQDLGVDTGPLAARLAFARGAVQEGRAADAEAIVDEVLSAARRRAEGGEPARPRAAGDLRALVGQLVGEHLRQELTLFRNEIEQTVRRLVQSAVAEALDQAQEAKHEATGVVRKAISTLPSRDDLAKLEQTIRADLDWRIERVAAERGWCSLSDVKAAVAKELTGQAPHAPTSFPRLEAALSEFVQQMRDRDTTLMAALQAAPAPMPVPAIDTQDGIGTERVSGLEPAVARPPTRALEPVTSALAAQARLLAPGGDLGVALRALLPDALNDPAVRERLYAIITLEAVAHPGALGEATGLRAYLRGELERLAEAVPAR
jgi:hypothetical protein